jgi:hypothetical protein
VHEKNSLAAEIAYYFQKLAEEAPDIHMLKSTPGVDGIRGTLQACEDQTSAFNWRNLLIAVGSTLELTETNM